MYFGAILSLYALEKIFLTGMNLRLTGVSVFARFFRPYVLDMWKKMKKGLMWIADGSSRIFVAVADCTT